MAKDSGVTFIDPTSYHGSKDIGFEFILNRLLLMINTVYLQGDTKAYIRGVNMLVNTSWYQLSRNKNIKSKIEALEKAHEKAINNARTREERQDLELNKAEEVHRLLVDLHNVGGETIIYDA